MVKETFFVGYENGIFDVNICTEGVEEISNNVYTRRVGLKGIKRLRFKRMQITIMVLSLTDSFSEFFNIKGTPFSENTFYLGLFL